MDRPTKGKLTVFPSRVSPIGSPTIFCFKDICISFCNNSPNYKDEKYKKLIYWLQKNKEWCLLDSHKNSQGLGITKCHYNTEEITETKPVKEGSKNNGSQAAVMTSSLNQYTVSSDYWIMWSLIILDMVSFDYRPAFSVKLTLGCLETNFFWGLGTLYMCYYTLLGWLFFCCGKQRRGIFLCYSGKPTITN